MTPHTYTAADFQNLDPDALNAMGVKIASHPGTGIVDIYFFDFEGEQACYSAMQLDAAAALLIGMVAGRCSAFHLSQWMISKQWECTLVSIDCINAANDRAPKHPSPLAAALAAYGEMVRSQRKEDGDGK